MITENGMASHDWVGVDGKVHDQARVKILWLVILVLTSVQLRTVWIWQDISHGPVMGFPVGILGGTPRDLDLFYTDYNTQKRTWKDSIFLLKNIIETKRENL